ncbi:MAG: M48 family metalloprotease, partial [Nitrososphaerota archaeon]|nr:M48 family metalloprotease [Nitrososphaerota archaeon]
DAVLAVIFLVLARFPLAIRVGQRAVPLTDEHLLASFHDLARKMGVENVNLYSVDWEKFKIANAFQVGPRKFSVYVSNYLLEGMSAEEVSAVMAHELAHAKKKHVAKSLALFLFPLAASMNILIVGATFMENNIVVAAILIVTGVGSIFVIPRIAFHFRRNFELEADAVAARTIDDPRAMITALKKLADLSLIPAAKGSATHPSIMVRVQRIEQLTKS